MEIRPTAKGTQSGYSYENKEHWEDRVTLHLVDDAEARAAGDVAFSSGRDMVDPPKDSWRGVPNVGIDLEKPIICALTGWCIGGSLVYPLMSDIIIADESVRLFYPEPKVGASGGIMAALTARVPYRIAMEVMLLGEEISVQRLYDVGFINKIVPKGKHNEEAQTWARKIADNLYSVGMIRSLPAIDAGRSVKTKANLYVGPQLEKQLEAIYPGLELVKDYGWLTILAKPLFWLLDQLHGLLHNWGWSIVALVVLIKAAFYWLNAQAYRSMAKMKAINPRVMELRERMKDNPQQMQMEMMKLYREEKVNPMGGCLPIAIQIPVFIALYWVLLSTVEMRDAAWLYISDLAQPDTLFGVIPGINLPLGPLPILMTASSLLQTWLNPTPPDPMQAKLMWIMPLAFSFMFFFFPSGLVLYWFTNNLLSIAQQWMINKQLGVNN